MVPFIFITITVSASLVLGEYCPNDPRELNIGENGCLILLDEESNNACVTKVAENPNEAKIFYRLDRTKAQGMCLTKYQAYLILPKQLIVAQEAEKLLKKFDIDAGFVPVGMKPAQTTDHYVWEDGEDVEVVGDGDRNVGGIKWIKIGGATDYRNPPFLWVAPALTPMLVSPETLDTVKGALVYIVCHKTVQGPPPPPPATPTPTPPPPPLPTSHPHASTSHSMATMIRAPIKIILVLTALGVAVHGG